MGDMILDRMRNDPVWRFFIESVWQYQYVRNPIPLTDELANTLYDESQGITDFAVKIFLLAQARAIVTSLERLNASVIRSVAADSLRLARPVLRALRVGDTSVLSSLSDIHPIDFDTAMRDIQRNQLLQELSSTRVPSAQAAPTTPPEAPLAAPAATPPVPNSKPPRKRSKVDHPPQEQAADCLLTALAKEGEAAGLSAHEALLKQGVIRPLIGNGND